MHRLAVDVDPDESLNYYEIVAIFKQHPLMFSSSFKIDLRLDLTFDYFVLLAVL